MRHSRIYSLLLGTYYNIISLRSPHPPFIMREILGKYVVEDDSPHPPFILYLRVLLLRALLRFVFFLSFVVIVLCLRVVSLLLFPNKLKRDIPNNLLLAIIYIYNYIK